MPLTGFGLLMGVFGAGVGAGLYWLNKRERLSHTPQPNDWFLLALANHKLAWLLATDQVTSPLRAGFTRYEEGAGKGSVKVSPRGQGLQRAVGELVTCPYCTAVWTSAFLTGSFLAFPATTRAVATALSLGVAADYLHVLWARTK